MGDRWDLVTDNFLVEISATPARLVSLRASSPIQPDIERQIVFNHGSVFEHYYNSVRGSGIHNLSILEIYSN